MSSKEKNDTFRATRWIGCPIEADYFGEERKSGKMARKMASATDLSKYKKTDQKKLAKQPKEIPSENETFERGRVLSITSQGITVDKDGKEIICTLRGLLKKDKTQSKNLVTVGDFVLFERDTSDHGVIAHVEPRRSVLSRAENLSRKKEQLIAANIDQVLIVVSVVLPPLKPALIDRYIIAADKGGMTPIVIINKVDLLQNPAQQHEKDLYETIVGTYQTIGVPILSVSTITGEGLEELKQVMKDKASVFSGQSGVGKSSLINAVTNYQLRIGDLVEKTKKGTHTTTMAQLLRLEFGGWCVDTPGIKSFGVWDLDSGIVQHYFPEIFEAGRQCRFPDCSHLNEEGCAVIRGVEEGSLSALRYESYASLLLGSEESHYRR